jgi:hypothetical protein
MAKIVILYWEVGSCGDFIHHLLLSSKEYRGVVENFNIDQQGRVVPSLAEFFKSSFEQIDDMWYFRTWTEQDINILLTFVNKLGEKTFVIPTHLLDQANFLKSHLPGSIIVGISYPDNMFSLVLKSWCKKVAAYDKKIIEIYNQPLHQYMRKNNQFGEYILSEQLKFGTRIRSSVSDQFDICISLEDLFAKNLKIINLLFQDKTHVQSMFDSWITKQNRIHQYKYNFPLILQQALGYNSKAQSSGDLNCLLDTFDNILIKHYLNKPKQTIPNFQNIQQALDFFTNDTL